MNRLDTLLYWLCIVLVAAETLYGLFWGELNIGIRMGWWTLDYPPGLHTLIPTLSFWQEAAFFTHIVLNGLALALLIKRSTLCLPAFILAFILDRMDWIVMGFNPVANVRNDTDHDITAFISSFGEIGLMAIVQLLTIAAMGFLAQTGQIRWRGGPYPRP